MSKDISSSQQVLQALREASEKIEKLNKQIHEPIAVIGIGCRLPGANGPEAFWELLHNGVDAVSEVPKDRWDVDAYYDPDPETPGKAYTRCGGFIDQADQFDPQFFDISPREAKVMDPQQRLLLEVSWEALEHAGQASDKLWLSSTGVFVGVCTDDYQHLHAPHRPEEIDPHFNLGNIRSVAAGRIAYVMGLQGPNIQLDTACSSSLVAVHLACQSLREGGSDLALAGGVNLILSPYGAVGRCRMRSLSPDGRCKTFDASANGYVQGEGCGIVVLKRLSDALADRDNILAVIRGSGVNHDGPSSGLTVPNEGAQEKLVRQVLKNARVDPQEISYIETHGTGTVLGDPIEVHALGAIFGRRAGSLPIGSVKTNFGHLEAAAGISSLIKVVLSLQHREIPPHLHFTTPNPHISWEELPFIVPTTPLPWLEEKRLAGVSSFGISGTNAHVILENGPVMEAKKGKPRRSWQILTISAKNEGGLKALAQRYREFLEGQLEGDLEDICYTSHLGRKHFAHRLSVVGQSAEQMQKQLATFVKGEVEKGYTSKHRVGPKVAFLFTGQGPQYVGMGRELYETQPTFKQAMEQCDKLLRPHLDRSLLDLLYGENPAPLDDMKYTQPALFALEYALSRLWQEWGIEPDVVMGHSLGEYVAACVAGVFSLADGLKLVATRGRLMQALPEQGEMVVVLAEEERVRAALKGREDKAAIAVINGPQSVVLSGRSETVESIVAELATAGVKSRLLNISHASHSPLMEPLLAEFGRVAQEVDYTPPQLALVSNVSGRLATAEIAGPEYWVKHMRATVQFAEGIARLREQEVSVFLEIGPQPTLLGMGRRCLENDREAEDVLSPTGLLRGAKRLRFAETLWLPSLREKRSDWQQMLGSLGELYEYGYEVNWTEFERNYSGRKVVLPTYAFQRQRYWMEASKRRGSGETLNPLIDKMIKSPLLKETVFETELSVERLPFLQDYQIYGGVILPGACQTGLVMSAAELTWGGQIWTMKDVVFPEPLLVAEQGARTMQLVLTPCLAANGTEAETEFQLISFEPEDIAEKSITQANGRLIAGIEAEIGSVSMAELRERCQIEVNVTELYQAAAAQQVVLGPNFCWLNSLWRGEGEALGKLKVSGEGNKLAGCVLPPGLLEACFQVANWSNEQAEILIPSAIGELRLYQPIGGQEWWCHARQTGEHQWDILLLDEAGQIIIQIKGLELRVIPPTLSERCLQNRLTENTQPKRGWQLRKQWQDATTEERQKLIEAYMQERIAITLALEPEQVNSQLPLLQLGFDSLLAIELKNKIQGELGVSLPFSTLLEESVANLAVQVGEQLDTEQDTTKQEEIPDDLENEGKLVPLAPAQQKLFNTTHPEAPHYSDVVMLLDITQEVNPGLVEEAVRQLIRLHETLRMRFVYTQDGWRQFVLAPDDFTPFFYIDLSDLETAKQDAEFEAVAEKLKNNLNLLSGPLLQVALFDFGRQRPNQLLIVVNHAVTDATTNSILLEDFQAIYHKLEGKETQNYLSKTTSFTAWVQRLAEYAQSETLEQELDYWLTGANQQPPCLPLDYPEGSNIYQSVRTLLQTPLSPDETHILREILKSSQASFGEVMLMALAQSFKVWTGESKLLVDWTIHGRNPIFKDLDVSRTVGFFANRFPLYLDVTNVSTPIEALESIKSQFRHVPNGGMGYSVLRYLSSKETITKKLQALPRPEIVFNFFGYKQLFNQEGIFSQRFVNPSRKGMGNFKRPYLIDIAAGVHDTQIFIRWKYSENVHRQTTIEQLQQNFMQSLQSLIHCYQVTAQPTAPFDTRSTLFRATQGA